MNGFYGGENGYYDGEYPTTSQEFIDMLRECHTVIVNRDSNWIAIPEDIIDKTVKMLNKVGGSSIEYRILNPRNLKHKKIRITNCGFVE